MKPNDTELSFFPDKLTAAETDTSNTPIPAAYAV